MNAARDPWAGITSSVRPESDAAGVYRVGFVWGLMHARGHNGEPEEAQTTAVVRVTAQGKAEGDATVLDYRPPKQPLPHLSQHDFESKARELVGAYIRWVERLADLVSRVEQWGKELGWATRRIEKKLFDRRFGDHPEQALLLQEDSCRALLEPIGRSAPGVEGVVDLYLMPAYDDIASLYYYGGGWNVHYPPQDDPAAETVREKTSAPLSKEVLRQVLEEMKQHAA